MASAPAKVLNQERHPNGPYHTQMLVSNMVYLGHHVLNGGAIIDHEAPRERGFVVYYCSAV
jgi:hypothetical protein